MDCPAKAYLQEAALHKQTLEALKYAHQSEEALLDRAEKAEADVAALREGLEPFARLAVADDFMRGLDPDQLRHHVAKARSLLSDIEG